MISKIEEERELEISTHKWLEFLPTTSYAFVAVIKYNTVSLLDFQVVPKQQLLMEDTVYDLQLGVRLVTIGSLEMSINQNNVIELIGCKTLKTSVHTRTEIHAMLFMSEDPSDQFKFHIDRFVGANSWMIWNCEA